MRESHFYFIVAPLMMAVCRTFRQTSKTCQKLKIVLLEPRNVFQRHWDSNVDLILK